MIQFNIFGQETRPDNREISFVSETLSTTNPGTQYQAAPGQPIGYMSQKQSSHTGYTAQLWKVVTVDGVEQNREIFNKSTYKASPRIVLVGTASGSPDAVNAMNAAISSQSEGAISAAAAQWNDAAIAERAAAEAAAQQPPVEQPPEQQPPQEPVDETPSEEAPREDDDDKGDDKKDKKDNKGDKEKE